MSTTHEQSWEGELELLQPDRPPRRLFGRLWRRDTALGIQWGGQVELPTTAEHRPLWGACAVRLPDGREAAATLSAGAEDAGTAHPVLLGRGLPPFGPPANDRPALTASPLSPVPDRVQASPAAEKAAPPPPPQQTGPWAAQAGPAGGTANEDGDQFERTEALARAFVHASEARRAFRAADRQQLGAAVADAVLETVDELVRYIESRLRAADADGPLPDGIRQTFTILRWLGSLLDASDAARGITPGLDHLAQTLDVMQQPVEAA